MNFRFFIFLCRFCICLCEFLMNCCPDFATNSRKEWRLSLFQSILRKRIRKLPKILKFVKSIQYYSILFYRVLSFEQGDEGEHAQTSAVAHLQASRTLAAVQKKAASSEPSARNAGSNKLRAGCFPPAKCRLYFLHLR